MLPHGVVVDRPLFVGLEFGVLLFLDERAQILNAEVFAAADPCHVPLVKNVKGPPANNADELAALPSKPPEMLPLLLGVHVPLDKLLGQLVSANRKMQVV